MLRLSSLRTIRSILTCGLIAAGAAAQAQQVFRITAIPDESPTELARKAAPLIKYAGIQEGYGFISHRPPVPGICRWIIPFSNMPWLRRSAGRSAVGVV